MTGNSNDKVNFTHKFLLTNRQVSSLCKAFAKYLSANITILKTQLSKIIQSGGFIGRLPGPLMAINFSLIKNLLTPLTKRVFISLVLTAASAERQESIKIFSDLEILETMVWVPELHY